jgi:hypothetical protein
MKQVDMFKKLGAVLANSRWSWGAARSDGVVFLRVWHDRIKEEGAKRYAQVTHINSYVKRSHPGIESD